LRCFHCTAFMSPREFACTHCGSLRNPEHPAERIACERHDGDEAVATCLVCGVPVCRRCAVLRDGKFFCSNPEHGRIFEDSLVVYTGQSSFEAAMIVHHLSRAGLASLTFSLRDHVETFWLAGDENHQVRVQRTEARTALELLENLGLMVSAEQETATH